MIVSEMRDGTTSRPDATETDPPREGTEVRMVGGLVAAPGTAAGGVAPSETRAEAGSDGAGEREEDEPATAAAVAAAAAAVAVGSNSGTGLRGRWAKGEEVKAKDHNKLGGASPWLHTAPSHRALECLLNGDGIACGSRKLYSSSFLFPCPLRLLPSSLAAADVSASGGASVGLFGGAAAGAARAAASAAAAPELVARACTAGPEGVDISLREDVPAVRVAGRADDRWVGG